MSEIKTPPPPPPIGPAKIDFGGWIPPWLKRRLSWALGQPYQPATDASTDALRPATQYGAFDADGGVLGASKTIIQPPPELAVPFELARQGLAAIPAPLHGENTSVLDCLGAENTWRGRLIDALEAGVLWDRVVAVFAQANEAGRFADVHYTGGDIWRALIAGGGSTPIDVTPAPTTDLPPTKDVHQAFLRLEDGIGWAGNGLVPNAYAEAQVCLWARPRGYEQSDPLLVLFVFGFGADTAASPAYADMYAHLTAEEFLALQYRTGRPSGGDETQVLPGPGGRAPRGKS